MDKSFEQVLEEHRHLISQDKSVEEIITSLHSEGLTIIDSMKAVKMLYGVRLGIAKELVSSHPVWSNVVEQNKPFHEELIKWVLSWANETRWFEWAKH